VNLRSLALLIVLGAACLGCEDDPKVGDPCDPDIDFRCIRGGGSDDLDYLYCSRDGWVQNTDPLCYCREDGQEVCQ
jgi:hypothetical protein